MDLRKLSLYTHAFLKQSQLAVERNFFIQPTTGSRQEWWVLANKQIINVANTHGQTAAELIEARG
jgi:hypothetical protein